MTINAWRASNVKILINILNCTILQVFLFLKS